MDTQYNENYYTTNHGYTLFHLTGEKAGTSTRRKLHYEGTFVIFYFVKGTGSLKVEANQYDISEGDIIFINPRELYQLNVDNDKYHERISLHVNETLLKFFPDKGVSVFMNFHKRKSGEYNVIPASIVKKNNIDNELFRILELAKSNEPINTVLSICKITEFLINLWQNVLSQCPKESKTPNEHPLIRNVINYIKQHLTENINIDVISKEFNVGKSYLSHIFKDQMGISLWNYVIFRRIHHFNHLIKENDSLEDSCYQVGFKNYSNFFRLYKKHMNMTPTEFKKQVSNELA